MNEPKITHELLKAVYPTLRRWVDGFFVSKRAQGVAASTSELYRKHLTRFVDYCESRGVVVLEGIDATLIREYLIGLGEAGHNPGGVHMTYRAIKSFLRWYEVEAEPEGWRNPIKKVKAPKVPEEILSPVLIPDVMRMVDACKPTWMGPRDKAILLTLLDTGARASELTGFDLGDFDSVSGALTIRKGKGGKGRVVFVGQRTRKALRAYLRVRGDRPGPLFMGRDGVRLAYHGLRMIIIHRAREAGVEPIPSLHSFRRAFALELLRSGVDLLTIQRLLGHSDLSILKRYVKQTSEDLRIAHAAHSPVDRAG